MTTHYMDEAEWCDRIAIMDHGEIVALDSPESLKGGIGEDRVTIHTDNDAAAIAALQRAVRDRGHDQRRRGGPSAWPAGEQFVPRLFAEFELPIRSVSCLAPTLDDVFMSFTGSSIRDAEEDGSKHKNRVMMQMMTGGGTAMSTTVEHQRSAPPRPSSGPLPVSSGSAFPQRSFTSELRAIRIVWRRELIRFRSDRLRMITSLIQPLLFLFVLGAGLQQLSRAGTHGVDLKTFIYPGILCIAVHVHGDVLGRLDRVGPGVRLPARDDGGGRSAAARS